MEVITRRVQVLGRNITTKELLLVTEVPECATSMVFNILGHRSFYKVPEKEDAELTDQARKEGRVVNYTTFMNFGRRDLPREEWGWYEESGIRFIARKLWWTDSHTAGKRNRAVEILHKYVPEETFRTADHPYAPREYDILDSGEIQVSKIVVHSRTYQTLENQGFGLTPQLKTEEIGTEKITERFPILSVDIYQFRNRGKEVVLGFGYVDSSGKPQSHKRNFSVGELPKWLSKEVVDNIFREKRDWEKSWREKLIIWSQEYLDWDQKQCVLFHMVYNSSLKEDGWRVVERIGGKFPTALEAWRFVSATNEWLGEEICQAIQEMLAEGNIPQYCERQQGGWEDHGWEAY